MKIISVVGVRPNFMKIAPFIEEVNAYNHQATQPVQHILVHTGQHYDDRMSKAFFEALNIPEADINLGIGSGSHAEQVGNTMIAFEKVLLKEKPDWIIVLGDVNATLACSVATKKLYIKVCHIEAGKLSVPNELEDKYGLCYSYQPTAFDQFMNKAKELLETPNLKEAWAERRQKFLNDKIDVTAFMVWFIENYPKSAKIMKENPDYQYRFK